MPKPSTLTLWCTPVQDEASSGASLSHAKLAGVIAGVCAAAVLALGD